MEYLGDSKPVNLKVPLVSVCVATFQHFKFIEKCLQSILQQKTSFDYEILIGEDVSTDGTRELCIHYAEKHQRTQSTEQFNHHAVCNKTEEYQHKQHQAKIFA